MSHTPHLVNKLIDNHNALQIRSDKTIHSSQKHNVAAECILLANQENCSAEAGRRGQGDEINLRTIWGCSSCHLAFVGRLVGLCMRGDMVSNIKSSVVVFRGTLIKKKKSKCVGSVHSVDVRSGSLEFKLSRAASTAPSAVLPVKILNLH